MRMASLLLASASLNIFAVPFFFAAPAYAQTAPAADDASTDDENIIVVTAQKREQNLQEVPVSINVITAESIDNYDVKNFEDVARVSPSLSVDTGDAPSGNVIRMRGIGTAAFSISAESSVAVIVDEVPLMLTAQAFGNLEDIERVEVLKGPQGTLFGKNASAGVVNVVTQAPTNTLTGKINLRATSDKEYKGSVSLSGPLGEDLGFRVNGYYLDREGYITNLFDRSKLGGDKAWGIRTKLAFEPSDEFDLALIADISRRESSSGSPFIALPRNDPFREQIVAGPDNLTVQNDTANAFETETDMLVGKFNIDFGGAIFSSISSYQRFKLSSVNDLDASTQTHVFNPFLNPMRAPDGTPYTIQSAVQESKAFSQEFRLTSDGSGPFEYMVGAWYSIVKHDRQFDRVPLRFVISRWNAEAENESMALFGQATYELAPGTFIDAGVRANQENINVTFVNLIPNVANPPRYDGSLPGAPAVTFRGKDEDSAVTGKVALRHIFDSGTMVYGSVSTGYKGQTYDVASGFNQRKADNPVRAETSTAYELGLKGNVADGALRYDVSIFRSDFTDFQAQGAVPIATGGVEFSLNNVGKLRTKGAEVNLNWAVTDTLNLDFSGAYIDAKVRSFPFAQCYAGQTVAQGCVLADVDGNGSLESSVQDLSGSRLANSPKFKFNVGAYWEDNLGSLPFNTFVQGNYQWQDDINYDLFGNPTNAQDAYGLANFSVGIKEPEGAYELSLFVNNAFDTLYYSRVDDTSSRRTDGLQQITVQRARESRRYGGIKVRFAF
jgi:iron complex outermembrane receptor protein